MLSLAGDTTGWMLLPDGIHLPLLEEFKLAVNNLRPVMKAIIAPQLLVLIYSLQVHGGRVNFGTGSKLNLGGKAFKVNL